LFLQRNATTASETLFSSHIKEILLEILTRDILNTYFLNQERKEKELRKGKKGLCVHMCDTVKGKRGLCVHMGYSKGEGRNLLYFCWHNCTVGMK